jgi:uncharacterized protein (DUF342 family)
LISRFPITALQPGMTLLKAVSSEGGELLPAGAVVTERHIRQLQSWGLEAFEVEGAVSLQDVVKIPEGAAPAVIDLVAAGLEKEAPKFVPKGYETEGGATYIVEEPITHAAEPVTFPRGVLVYGEIGPGVTIEAGESIQVVGGIAAGAKLTAGGDLTVKGAVTGSAQGPVLLTGGNISLDRATRAIITARENVTAVSLLQCATRASGLVTVTGAETGIVGGETEGGIGIHAAAAGGEGSTFAVLRVSMARQKQLFQAVTKLEKMIVEKEAEVGRLEKIMEVIRLLGEKVVALPPEKKQELAMQSKRYMDLKNEIQEHRATIERIRVEVESSIQSIEECPVKIKRILPGLEIVIGSATLRLSSRQGATGYHLKAGRILAISH